MSHAQIQPSCTAWIRPRTCYQFCAAQEFALLTQHPKRRRHPHLRQPLASRGSAKTRAGSNHGEPTPLTLASRCGSVGPLLRPGECTTTPSPPGEYDEARGSRPQDVGVSSPRRHSQRPTKGARRRRTASRLSTPTKAHQAVTTSRQGSKRGSAPADPKTTKTGSVGGRTDQP